MANFSPIPAKALTLEKCHERFSRTPFGRQVQTVEEVRTDAGGPIRVCRASSAALTVTSLGKGGEDPD